MASAEVKNKHFMVRELMLVAFSGSFLGLVCLFGPKFSEVVNIAHWSAFFPCEMKGQICQTGVKASTAQSGAICSTFLLCDHM